MGGQLADGQPPILDLLNLEYIEQNLYRSCVLADAQRPGCTAARSRRRRCTRPG